MGRQASKGLIYNKKIINLKIKLSELAVRNK